MLIDYSHRLVLVMSDKLVARGKNRLWNSQVLAVAYRIGFTARDRIVLANGRCTFKRAGVNALHGGHAYCFAMLGWTAQIHRHEGLTDLYPLPAQTYLHKSAMTLVLLSTSFTILFIGIRYQRLGIHAQHRRGEGKRPSSLAIGSPPAGGDSGACVLR